MKFKECIVLGTGQFAVFCALEMQKQRCNVVVIDTNNDKNDLIQRACEHIGVNYAHYSKDELTKYLLKSKQQTLLISAINPWIIPDEVLNNEVFTSINLHHSLLPKHPGRNAEAWAIYEGENETGITWHITTREIDKGDIIVSKSVEITNSCTSFSLLRAQDKLARDAFLEILESLIENRFNSNTYLKCEDVKIHYSWQKPNNGYLDIRWSAEKMSRFLRAMDYGILNIFGAPKLSYNKIIYTWSKYNISDNEDFYEKSKIEKIDNKIVINKDDKCFILSNVKEIEVNN